MIVNKLENNNFLFQENICNDKLLINNQNNIVLEVIGYEEPNNGRELLLLKLSINGIDQTRKYFTTGNRMPRYYDQASFQFTDKEQKFCFAATENESFLIDVINLDKIQLGQNFTKAGYFTDNLYIMIDKHKIYIKNLEDRSFQNIRITNFEIEFAYFISENLLKIIHSEGNIYSIFDVKKQEIIEEKPLMSNKEFEMTRRWCIGKYERKNGKNYLYGTWISNSRDISNFNFELID